MQTSVKTKSKPAFESTKKWETAISDATDLLRKVELRADRLRATIKGLMELRDAGEPYRQVEP
jgi:hypothetical protein